MLGRLLFCESGCRSFEARMLMVLMMMQFLPCCRAASGVAAFGEAGG